MENTIQMTLINKLLLPISKITDKLSTKIKNNIFVISCVLLFLVNFYYNSEKYMSRYLYVYTFDCLMFGIMILSSLNKDIKPIKFDKLLTCIWFGIGIGMFISSIFMYVDYIAEAILFLIAYPIAFFVWNNCDYKKIFSLLIKSCELSFLVYLVINFVFFPITEHQYQGFFNNVNGTAFYLTCVFCCYFSKLLIFDKFNKKNVFDLCMFGICSALMFYTNSRTGQLAALCSFIFTIILEIIINGKNFKNIFLHNVLPMIISAMIFFLITMPIFQIPQICLSAINSISSYNSANTNEISNQKNNLIENEEKSEIFGISVAFNYNNQKVFEKGDTLDRISSGRLSIWKDYIKQLNFIGNQPPTVRAVSNHDDFSLKHSTAHMTILEIAYTNGIFTGILYLLFNIIAGFKSIKFALNNKNDKYCVIPFAFTVAFGVVSMVSSLSSFAYMIASYYYFVQTPIMIKTEKKYE